MNRLAILMVMVVMFVTGFVSGHRCHRAGETLTVTQRVTVDSVDITPSIGDISAERMFLAQNNTLSYMRLTIFVVNFCFKRCNLSRCQLKIINLHRV